MVNNQFQDFSQVLGGVFASPEELQKQFQEHFAQAMAVFSGNPIAAAMPNFGSMPTGASVSPQVTMGAIGPFLNSMMAALQHSFSQIPMNSLSQLQAEYGAELARLLSSALATAPRMNEADGAAAPLDQWIDGDKRFESPAWHDHGVYEFTAALYSLNSRFTRKVAEMVPAQGLERKKVDYAIEQFIDALSPSNFFVTNPDAQKKLLETKGESLTQGIRNLIEDIQKGRISQTDENAFEVGVNVATSKGHVVFENDYFQLIQYAPSTAQVGKRPMLFVPPCINKFYILDLQPDNSLVKYVVDQGHTLFLVSWKNPTESESHFSWDGYVQDGVMVAIDVVKSISKQKDINILGFCVGGTLLATALSALSSRGDDSIHSVTFLTTLLDFTDTGALGIFVDEDQVKAREESIGKGGIMPGKDLSGAFSSLRPNDLIWNYAVNNYLKGEKPPVFDLLYWNSDSTNLAGPMFAWYLRNTYLENKICQPGKAVVCGEPVDLGLIQAPVYVFAAKEDHIVPWTSAYQTSHLVGGDVRFVLGASGHIAGTINPASKNKRSYWSSNAALPDTADQWISSAVENKGSWWKDWANWLEDKKGGEVNSPAKPGNAKYKPIEEAPGRYVKQRV